MKEFVGMTEATARAVGGLLGREEGARSSEYPREATQHRSQVIQEAPANTGAVVIRAIEHELDMKMEVQRVKLNEEGVWESDGDPFDMPTFPCIPAGAYELNKQSAGEPIRPGSVLPTHFVGGIEVVMLFAPHYPTKVRSDEPHRGCRPGLP